LGVLVKLEATVCSSFGSQHNECALSDMNTLLHGKLKVVPLPCNYNTALSQTVRPLCASRCFPFSNKTNFTILKLQYTFQLLFGALRTSDYLPRLYKDTETDSKVNNRNSINWLWIVSYYCSSGYYIKTGWSITWRDPGKGTAPTLLHQTARVPHRHFCYSSFVLDRTQSISVCVRVWVGWWVGGWVGEGLQIFQTSPLRPSLGQEWRRKNQIPAKVRRVITENTTKLRAVNRTTYHTVTPRHLRVSIVAVEEKQV
jgi:hypothetical protein